MSSTTMKNKPSNYDAAIVAKEFGTWLAVGACFALAVVATTDANKRHILLEPEFYKMLLGLAALVVSPALGRGLLAAYPPLTVCVKLVELLELFGRGVESSVTSAAEGLDRLTTRACDATSRAAVAFVSLLWAFRTSTAVVVVAASLACPPFGLLVVVGLVVWAFYQLVMAVVELVQCVFVLACAAADAAKEAAQNAARGVEAAAGSILAFRKCIVAAVVAASLACPPFCALVAVGLVFWAVYEAVQALVLFVQCVHELACAACAAAKVAANRAVRGVEDAACAVVDVVLAAAWSILGALLWGAVSLLRSTLTLLWKVLATLFWAAKRLVVSALALLWTMLASMFWGVLSLIVPTLTLLLRLLAFYLKTASVVLFLIDPSAETLYFALLIEAAIAVVKHVASRCWR